MAEKRRRMEAEESSDEESEGEEAAESVREQEGIEEDSEDEDVEQQRPEDEEESEQEEAADQARLSPHPLTAIRRVSPVAAVPPYHRGMAAAPSYCKPADVDHEGPTRSAPVQPPKPASGMNLYANDGSFLELFKKKMEQTSAGSSSHSEPRKVEEKSAQDEKRKPISFVGKRRGGARLALKTGMVAKKPKTEEEEVMSNKGGAWAQYMAEVKKYKAHQCSDDDKTRPLVK